MRRAGRVDANQPAIVEALRGARYSVEPLHGVGGGVPDLLVGAGCRCGFRLNFLLEVKDGDKPPSERLLTPAQIEWHRDWRGHVSVVLSPIEALDEMHHQLNRRCPVCGCQINR